MKFNPEFFSSEVIMQRLVEWFNAQPLNQRTITAGEFVIIRVKVLVTPNGEPVFIIGTDPSDIGDPFRKYIGEAAFVWVGPRGTDLTATSTSFFEISKFVHVVPEVNVVPFNATLKFPPALPPVYRMSYMWENTFDAEGGYSIGLTAAGVPEVVPYMYYEEPSAPVSNMTDVSSYGKAVAARRDDGTVWGWGGNYSHFVSAFRDQYPSQIPFDKPVRRIVVLTGVIIALYEDGTLAIRGDQQWTPHGVNTNPAWGSAWATNGFTDMEPNITNYTDIADIKGYSYSTESGNRLEQYVVLQRNDGSLAAWGAIFTNILYGGTPAVAGGYLATVNQSINTISQVDTFECNKGLIFALHLNGELTLFGEDSARFDVTTQLDGELGIKVAVTGNGSVGYLDDTGRAYVYPLSNFGISSDGWIRMTGNNSLDKITDISAGQDHVIVLTETHEIAGISEASSGVWTDNYQLEEAPRQIFAGNRATGVLLSNGRLEWYYGYGPY